MNMFKDHSPEDEVKRHKRRERNKIAAEKCRNKKKKETLSLFAESESVVLANARYKNDIARLEAEQRHLINILAQHQPACKKTIQFKEPSASQPSWHLDESNNFTVPTLPAIKPFDGKPDEELKTGTPEVPLPGDGDDYEMDDDADEPNCLHVVQYQPCSFVRSPPQLCEGYNPGYSYYDSVSLAII